MYPSLRTPDPSGERRELRPHSFLGIGHDVIAIGTSVMIEAATAPVMVPAG